MVLNNPYNVFPFCRNHFSSGKFTAPGMMKGTTCHQKTAVAPRCRWYFLPLFPPKHIKQTALTAFFTVTLFGSICLWTRLMLQGVPAPLSTRHSLTAPYLRLESSKACFTFLPNSSYSIR